MIKNQIKCYKCKGGWQLSQYYSDNTEVYPADDIRLKDYRSRNLIALKMNGELTIYKGFWWDGATVARDTATCMRGSCVHDALYMLIREGLLPKSSKKACDHEYIAICQRDGMSFFRQCLHWYALRSKFSKKATQRPDRTIRTFPPSEEK